MVFTVKRLTIWGKPPNTQNPVKEALHAPKCDKHNRRTLLQDGPGFKSHFQGDIGQSLYFSGLELCHPQSRIVTPTTHIRIW